MLLHNFVAFRKTASRASVLTFTCTSIILPCGKTIDYLLGPAAPNPATSGKVGPKCGASRLCCVTIAIAPVPCFSARPSGRASGRYCFSPLQPPAYFFLPPGTPCKWHFFRRQPLALGFQRVHLRELHPGKSAPESAASCATE